MQAADIPEDRAFADAFAALSRKDRKFVAEWLRNNYCRVEGLDYHIIRIG